MKRKKVLILGAGISYVDCIKAAKQMNCEVLVTDKNADAPGFRHADIALNTDISDIEGCTKLAKHYAIDGVVAVNDFGVMTAAKISETLGLPGIPVEAAEIATDKFLMRRVWKENGVPSVDFAKVTCFDEFLQAIDTLNYPLIIKPCDSSGGGCRGIKYIDESSDLSKAYQYATSFYDDKSLLVEKFVTGLEHSVEVIVYNGQSHIIAVSDKVKSPLPYRVDDTILYPTVETGKRLQWLKEAVEKSISAIGIKEGIAHIELSITENGPVLFEIGTRCGGGAPAPLVPYLCGVEEFKEAVRLALGDKPVNLSPLYMKGCVIKFFYPAPGIIKEISETEKIEDIPGVLFLGFFAKEGDYVGPLRTCSDRAGMVITGGENRQDALKLANYVIDTVKIETTIEETVGQI